MLNEYKEFWKKYIPYQLHPDDKKEIGSNDKKLVNIDINFFTQKYSNKLKNKENDQDLQSQFDQMAGLTGLNPALPPGTNVAPAMDIQPQPSEFETTEGVQVGAASPSSDVIEYVTMATFGNGTDFGNLTDARGCRGASDATRGVMAGGNDGSAQTNIIDCITIQTTGNAIDFGDMTNQSQQNGFLSDAHGGLG